MQKHKHVLCTYIAFRSILSDGSIHLAFSVISGKNFKGFLYYWTNDNCPYENNKAHNAASDMLELVDPPPQV